MTGSPDRALRPESGRLDGAWAYMLVTGDAIVSERLPWILDRLREHGLDPRVAAVLPFGAEEMCALYGATIDEEFFVEHPGGEDVTFSLAMHGDLYALVPACLVTLHHPAAEAFPALLRCKGTTRPEESPDGTVRRGGENVIFNLVHAPDDVDEARSELTRLLGEVVADALISDAQWPDGRHPSGVDSVSGRMPALHGPAATSTPLIVNALRARIVQRVALTAHPRDRPDLVQAIDALAAERGALLALDDPRARLAEAQHGNERLGAIVDRAVGRVGDPVVMEGTTALTELLVLEGRRRPEDIWAMRRSVFISPLEWVMLRGHSYGFRPNDTLRRVYGAGPAQRPERSAEA
jgi:hypothetical protein